MKASFFAGVAALAASVVATPAGQLDARQSSSKTPVITTKGNAFVNPDGSRFFIRGVDYQPGGSSLVVDPIANAQTCARDIQEFQKLGINTVRVYTVDNTANHDECMQALSNAGIYLALDVNSANYSINRNDPHGSYNDVYLQSVFATIDAFKGYDNTLLFFAGNEVINSDNTTETAPYVKAVIRDMKEYIRAQSKRAVPVGYSAADVSSNRVQTAEYMNCGTDDQRSDFFAFNDYSWCDPSSFQISGWDQRVKEFSNYSLPLFLSEFGCNTNKRTFEEIGALYNQEMTSVYSGGLVYEYSEEGNNYGIVTINSPTQVTPNDQFAALESQYAQNPSPTGASIGNPSGAASTCPPTSPQWQPGFTGDSLPAIPAPAMAFMKNGAGTGPGLNGPGSQDTGVASTGTASAGSASSTSAFSSSSSSAASAGLAPSMQMGTIATLVLAAVSTLVGAALL